MNNYIQSDAAKRSVSRLCHFTPSRNLYHVLQSGKILDRASLDEAKDNVLNATDSFRFDGHRDKICCSIEYPNAYYLDIAAAKDPLFKDWCVLFLRPNLLWKEGTLYCRQNAAKNSGAFVAGGDDGYRKLYEAQVAGRPRKLQHLAACPTDLQAEVLVPGPIDISDVLGIAVRTEEQLSTELVRLRVMGISTEIPFCIAPVLFDKIQLRDHIWAGQRPEEKYNA